MKEMDTANTGFVDFLNRVHLCPIVKGDVRNE